MKHRRCVGLILLGLALNMVSCSLGGGRATVREEKRVIKTYPFGDPDPVPILARSRNAGLQLMERPCRESGRSSFSVSRG